MLNKNFSAVIANFDIYDIFTSDALDIRFPTLFLNAPKYILLIIRNINKSQVRRSSPTEFQKRLS